MNKEIEILIVEDSLTQAEQLKYMLETYNYKVVVALDGEEAFEKAKIHQPTLIISDIIMPKMDGFELCKAIKSNHKLKDIPFILLTSLSNPDDIIKGLDSGADNFVLKPYNDKYLLGRIKSLLTNFEIRQSEKIQVAMEVYFGGKFYTINSERRQILDLLISTFENSVQQNKDLIKGKREMQLLNEKLEEKTADLTEANEMLKQEVEERKKAEADLKQRTWELSVINNELKQFATVASHDLREPLRMISSYTKLIEKKYKDKLDSDANEFINFIVDGSTRMENLIDQLLYYSRVGVISQKSKEADLDKVMENVVLNLGLLIEENKAIINYNNLPTVKADFTQMIQVFQNLISNAIAYCSMEPPIIDISFKVDNDKLIMLVSDNGIGIKKEDFDRIFIIFQRIDNKLDNSGSGIGLPICKKIVESYGGSIWLESEESKGTTFYFTLPV